MENKNGLELTEIDRFIVEKKTKKKEDGESLKKTSIYSSWHQLDDAIVTHVARAVALSSINSAEECREGAEEKARRSASILQKKTLITPHQLIHILSLHQSE